MQSIDWIKDIESGNVKKEDVDICIHCFGMNKKAEMKEKDTVHGHGYVCKDCLKKIYGE